MVKRMAKMFYLSFVYDLNGYDRYDMLSSNSLKDLDDVIAKYKNRDEILNHYMKDYHFDKRRGKVCIIFEDTDIKKREINLYGPPEAHTKKEINELYTYAHQIKVLYNDERLMNLEACLEKIKYKIFNKKVIDAIMLDIKTNDNKLISINKKFIFETENEKNLVEKDRDYDEAMACFWRRLKKESPDEQYFYCRVLVDICGLSYPVKKKVANLKVNTKKINEISDLKLTTTEILENESNNMDDLYTYYDLDYVIKHSPDSNRPIGSEGKKK